MNLKNWIKRIYADKFKRYLIGILVLMGIFLLFNGNDQVIESGDGLEVHYFFHPQCPHCKEQKLFNEKLIDKYPAVKFIYHDVTEPDEVALFRKFAEEKGIERLGIPGTFFGDYYNIGFGSAETTGKKIEKALDAYVAGQAINVSKEDELSSIDLPFLGEINVLDYSLPFLAVILGIVDGFNPCAMWVLVYLITLILSVNDRRKIWLIVGSFVFASGVLYFLFMTAWLNVFLYIGYLRPLTILIGLGAVGVGLSDLRSFFKKKAHVCDIGDTGSKSKTMSRIEQIVHSPLTVATIIGVIGLAFVVNSIEFACSAAIPAVFTQVLSLSNLSTLQHYGYILLYDFFFMLDDLIIFGLAAFAANTFLSHKYAKYSKLIGGVVILALGVLLAFAPHVLG